MDPPDGAPVGVDTGDHQGSETDVLLELGGSAVSDVSSMTATINKTERNQLETGVKGILAANSDKLN